MPPGGPPEVQNCELLHREILVTEDPLTGTHEVQRLVFALPAGAVVGSPPQHVKVRAPDAERQTMRVRAYSATMHDGAPKPYFNISVKIYPGGPPQSRGVSSFLGAVPVGEVVNVPAFRSMSWSMEPRQIAAQERAVGMIAFGIGIAEVIEPAEMLLAAGAKQVRLLYANRNARGMVMHPDVQRLIREYPDRMSVSHFLSRQNETETQCPAGSDLPSERFQSRRLDSAAVAEEFGAWFASSVDARRPEPLFLVVGTGAMNRAAWDWLHQLAERNGQHKATSLLRGGTGWVSWFEGLASGPSHPGARPPLPPDGGRAARAL
jgi:ferredoxin-NADP reductase